MALTEIQVRQLRAKLEAKHVKSRKANGADLHYVEGWHVIAEANRIFGYDAWDRRTLASRCVWSGESGAHHSAAYTAKVRVSVRAGDITIVREGSGTGEGKAPTRDKRMSSRSKVPKQTQPSVLSPRLATPLDLRFTTAIKSVSVRREVERLHLQQARGFSVRHLALRKRASTSQVTSPARFER